MVIGISLDLLQRENCSYIKIKTGERGFQSVRRKLICLLTTICYLPRSPKCAASMWLGCFLRMAVRPRANESMFAEMALMAIWLGPDTSCGALWFLNPREGECGLTGAEDGQKICIENKCNLWTNHVGHCSCIQSWYLIALIATVIICYKLNFWIFYPLNLITPYYSLKYWYRRKTLSQFAMCTYVVIYTNISLLLDNLTFFVYTVSSTNTYPLSFNR